MQGRFGEIRSAVQERPSSTSWNSLYEAIAQIDLNRFVDELLPYVSENLAKWPDEIRVCPQGWLDLLLDHGLAHPGLVLVRRLWRPHLTLDELEVLSKTSELSDLTYLSLVSNSLGEEAVPLVLDGESFANVWHLDASYNRFGDDGVQRLAFHEKAARLRHLALDNNGITERGAAMLADSPNLANLERLTLFGNTISANGFDALRTSPHLSAQVRREWAFTHEL